MQILTHERLWAAKRWMSWRNYYEHLNGTLWWLESIATLIAFIIPVAVMVSGAQTSTADPLLFTGAFLAMFCTRLWGAKRLMRHEIRWPTAYALRIFRVPVGGGSALRSPARSARNRLDAARLMKGRGLDARGALVPDWTINI